MGEFPTLRQNGAGGKGCIMSGGHFAYDQYRIMAIADEIERLIDCNDDTNENEWGGTAGLGYPPAVIAAFVTAVTALKVAEVYVQRIDWLVSGDDGEDNFLRRLEADLLAARGAS